MQKAAYWLMKTEPDVFSIDDLAVTGSEPWDGVRNYQARNHMRTMKVGELVLFYHSRSKPPGVAGLARVCKAAYPDATAWDEQSPYFDPKSTEQAPRWDLVDLEFVEKFPRLVSLEELKAETKLATMVVTRNSRLSVQPVEYKHFLQVLKMAGADFEAAVRC